MVKLRVVVVSLLLLANASYGQQSSRIDSLEQSLANATTIGDSVTLLTDLTDHFSVANNEKGFFYGNLLMNTANALQDSVKIGKAHLLLGKCFVFAGKYVEAKETIKKIENFAFQNDKKLSVQTGQYLGNLNRTLGNTDSALYYYEMAVENMSDSTDWYKLQRSLAAMEYTMGKVSATLERLLFLLEYEVRHGEERIASTCNNIAVIYANKDDQKKANEFHLKAIEELEKRDEPNLNTQLTAYRGAAETFVKLEDYDAAKKYLDKALALKNVVRPEQLSQLYYSKANILENTNQTDSISFYYKKIQSLIPEIEYYEQKLNAIVNYLNYSFQQGNFDEIKPYLNELINPEGEVNLSMTKSISEILNQYYFHVGDFERSRQYLNEYWLAKDSIEGLDQENRISELETEYETAQKDQQIENLTQKATIQELEISQKNNQLLIGGLVGVMLIFGGVFYYNSQRARKERQAAELQQRFLRSQMNPHFIFNSMTAIQNYLLQHQDTDQASHYIGLFSTLMRQILENSREEFISLGEEVKMLKNYMELQRIRFSENFTYNINIDDALDEEYTGIPPMFAQPFIENALEHGLFRKGQQDNHVSISFQASENKQVSLIIEDNGTGIVEKGGSPTHQSLATTITTERLDSFRKSGRTTNDLIGENIIGESGAIIGYRINLTLPSELISPA